MLKRIIWDIILFVSVFTLPWWVFVVLALAGSIYFKSYAEAVLGGLLMDSFYGTQTNGILSVPVIYTLYGAVVLFVGGIIKRYIRWR